MPALELDAVGETIDGPVAASVLEAAVGVVTPIVVGLEGALLTVPLVSGSDEGLRPGSLVTDETLEASQLMALDSRGRSELPSVLTGSEVAEASDVVGATLPVVVCSSERASAKV